jgi:hypothetical protein
VLHATKPMLLSLILATSACIVDDEELTTETEEETEVPFNPEPEAGDLTTPEGEGEARPTHDDEIGVLTVFTAFEGSDYGSIDTSNNWVEACDMEQDGNGVYAQFRSPNSTITVSDGNGSQGGCGNTFVSSATTEFRVCEDDFGSDTCTGWRRVR